MICPMISKKLPSKYCEVTSCRYNVSGNCAHSKVVAMERQREPIKDHYKLSDIELTYSTYRVATAVQAAKYFEFIFARSITEMKKKDIETIAVTAEKYKAWNADQTKPEFSDIIDMIEFISNNLT